VGAREGPGRRSAETTSKTSSIGQSKGACESGAARSEEVACTDRADPGTPVGGARLISHRAVTVGRVKEPEAREQAACRAAHRRATRKGRLGRGQMVPVGRGHHRRVFFCVR
jgi:hypothetical protein